MNDMIQCIEKIISLNDDIMSRTEVSGIIDNAVSRTKISSSLSPEEVKEIVRNNRKDVSSYIMWRGSIDIKSPLEMYIICASISEILNRNITRNSIIRTWPNKYYGENGSSEKEIAEKVMISMHDMFSKVPWPWNDFSEEEKLKEIAGIEWELCCGPLHPFSDGCGRVSRCMSTLLCFNQKLPFVMFESRDKYFENGKMGKNKFCEYYLNLPKRSLVI